MSGYFPVVGIVGSGALTRMMGASATALGVELLQFESSDELGSFAKRAAVVTVFDDSVPLSQMRMLEKAGAMLRPNSAARNFVERWNEKINPTGEQVISVLVARSPHGQASAWTPTQIEHEGTLFKTTTPAPKLSSGSMATAQTLALNIVKESDATGVMNVEINASGDDLSVGILSLGPTLSGSWTIEGSRTSQFEQHLRAILDLPLGDPTLCAPFTVSGSFSKSPSGNMYRPYLHLMARSPGLKIHQYRSEPPEAAGHVTATGKDLLDLSECVAHAVDYMSGVIDE